MSALPVCPIGDGGGHDPEAMARKMVRLRKALK